MNHLKWDDLHSQVFVRWVNMVIKAKMNISLIRCLSRILYGNTDMLHFIQILPILGKSMATN